MLQHLAAQHGVPPEQVVHPEYGFVVWWRVPPECGIRHTRNP